MLEVIKIILELSLFGSNEKQDSGYVYIPDQDSDEEDRRTLGIYHIPSSLFPNNCRVKQLSAGESFLEDIKKMDFGGQPQNLIVIPPFNGSRNLSELLRKAHRGWDLSSIAVKETIETLPFGSKLGIILPISFYASNSRPCRDARLYVSEKSSIETVISFSNRQQVFSGIHSGFKLCVLVTKIGQQNKKPVKFFRIPEIAELENPDDVIRDFKGLLKRGGGETTYGYVHRELIPPGEQLLYEKYHPSIRRKQEDIESYGHVIKLGDVGKVQRGHPFHKSSMRALANKETNLSKKDTQSAFPMIGGREILRDGTINFEEARHKSDGEGLLHLKPGDICIRQIANLEFDASLIFAEVTAKMPPLIADSHIIVFTPNSDITAEDKELLLAFLSSEFPVQWLVAQGASMQIHPNLIRDLPVPLLDEELKTACRSLSEAADQFAAWKNAAESARSALFNFGAAKDSRLFLLKTGRDARQRKEAAELVDDFDYRIRTRFPYPIAYKWSTIKSSYPDLEGYTHILECAEVMACYVAQICILTFKEIGLDIGYVKSISENLSKKKEVVFLWEIG